MQRDRDGEHGGRGASTAEQVIFHEEYARANAPHRVNHLGEELLGPTLIAFGTAEQQRRFLPAIKSLDELPASDVLSTTFGLSVNAVLWTMRFALFVVPPIAAFATHRLCRELSARDGLPTASRVQWRDIPRRLRHGADAEP